MSLISRALGFVGLNKVVIGLVAALIVSGLIVKHYIAKSAISDQAIKQSVQLLKEEKKKLKAAVELNDILNSAMDQRERGTMIIEKHNAMLQIKLRELASEDETGCLNANHGDNVRLWLNKNFSKD